MLSTIATALAGVALVAAESPLVADLKGVWSGSNDQGCKVKSQFLIRNFFAFLYDCADPRVYMGEYAIGENHVSFTYANWNGKDQPQPGDTYVLALAQIGTGFTLTYGGSVTTLDTKVPAAAWDGVWEQQIEGQAFTQTVQFMESTYLAVRIDAQNAAFMGLIEEDATDTHVKVTYLLSQSRDADTFDSPIYSGTVIPAANFSFNAANDTGTMSNNGLPFNFSSTFSTRVPATSFEGDWVGRITNSDGSKCHQFVSFTSNLYRSYITLPASDNANCHPGAWLGQFTKTGTDLVVDFAFANTTGLQQTIPYTATADEITLTLADGSNVTLMKLETPALLTECTVTMAGAAAMPNAHDLGALIGVYHVLHQISQTGAVREIIATDNVFDGQSVTDIAALVQAINDPSVSSVVCQAAPEIPTGGLSGAGQVSATGLVAALAAISLF